MSPGAMAPTLDTPTRLKLARSIIDKTCDETGAGYLLVMLVPGTDQVLRSFHGLDSRAECVAMAAEVAGMMHQHADKIEPKEAHVVAAINGQ